jgi:hypothetical protein
MEFRGWREQHFGLAAMSAERPPVLQLIAALGDMGLFALLLVRDHSAVKHRVEGG